MTTRTRLAQVCALLNAEQARYLVVGATAMQFWGTSRATRDIDLLIEPEIENASRVLRALSELPFRVAEDILPQQLLDHPVTMIGDTPNVDVLTRAWNLTWAVASTDIRVFVVEDVPIPTVSLEHLILSKRTGRLQDQADVEVLEALRSRGLR